MTSAVRRYQKGLQAVRNEVVGSLVPLFSTLDESELNRSFPGYARRAVPVIRAGEQKAIALAVEFYGAERDAAEASGDMPRRPGPLAAARQIETSLFVTGPVEVKRALADGASLDEAMRRGQVATAASGGRLAVNAGRHHVETLVGADDSAKGWQRRVTSKNPCAFCAMLASRGATYKGRYMPRTQYHDLCACIAVPVFTKLGDNSDPQAVFYSALWRSSTKGKRGKDAVNAFRKALAAIRAS